MPTRDELQRNILPIPDRPRSGLITYDAKDPETKYPPIDQLRPPSKAPNVLVILIDDAGYGSSSAFGGPCQTPNAEKLASIGLKYLRFHTTALCSPTRQALLTGSQPPTTVGMGRPSPKSPSGSPRLQLGAPEHLRAARQNAEAQWLCDGASSVNGHVGAGVGDQPGGPVQCLAHRRAAASSTSTASSAARRISGTRRCTKGPRRSKSRRRRKRVYQPDVGHDLTRAIAWIGQQKAAHPGQAVLRLLSPHGATHAPHHVPKEWADKYKGKFDQGWDKVREETLARQKKLGVVPADCQLTARHEQIPAWDKMPEALKPVLRREMEIYAGFMEVRRPPRRPAAGLAEGSPDRGRHARLLHHRRQRRVRRGHADGTYNEMNSTSTAGPRSRRRNS